MKKLFLLSVVALVVSASSLSSLIEKAQKNELIDVYKAKLEVSSKTYDSVKSSYMPKVDLGASGQLISPKDSLGAGQIYNAHVVASLVLLDGFRRENILDEKTKIRLSSQYDLAQIKKDVSLQVSTLYLSLRTTQADVDALLQTKEQLKEQLKQQKIFYKAKLSTEDNVVRIEAAVANIDYKIEVKHYESDEIIAKLYTLTNEIVESVTQSTIKKPQFETTQELDSIKSIQAQVEAIHFKAEQVDSSYYPSIILKDTFGYTGFRDDGLEDLGIPNVDRVNTQNTLMINLSMNIIDFSAAAEQKQAVLAQRNAIKAQLALKRKESKADLALAKRGIKRSLKLLEASLLSQKASERTFQIVNKKYKAHIVDYVKYLDALAQKTQAQYNRALGALEISYARYYYFAGLDIKEYVND